MRNPEARTRTELIDPKLLKAGWDVTNPKLVGLEVPADGKRKEESHAIADYVLYLENGDVLAVVEAKKKDFDALFPQQQLETYISEFAKRQSFRPFGFTSNGLETYFYDGTTAMRQVPTFFTAEDMRRMLKIRQDGKSLAQVEINQSITNRSYQIEAVRRICEAFEQLNKRRALLVMATGTGKTRTAMSIIDLFMRADRARKILFVADRDELVEQALTEGFQKHIPSEPCARIHNNDVELTSQNRLCVVTLQTLGLCYEKISPATFDLIIFDEVHRSIFQQYSQVLEYFDALMVGLTATPADFVDRDTFNKFHIFDEPPTPTYLYKYDDAVRDKVLVDYKPPYQAKTRFQEQGIRGAYLSEEHRNALIQQGLDPDEIDYEGSELEKTVSNRDTLRKQWEEFMEICIKDKSGQYPGKTIVFAMSQDHAQRLVKAFNDVFPQYPKMARVITSKTEFHRSLIKQFKKNDQPRIAVSVDMLETGVDVPEVVNLVFMRPVQSSIKLQQMIGRGTRNNEACNYPEWLPEDGKTRFLVIDFMGNDFGIKSSDDAPAQTLPVLVALFNTRLKLLEKFLSRQDTPECMRIISSIRNQLSRIPRGSYIVEKEMTHIGEVWEDDFWRYVTPAKMNLLRVHVAPLMRFVPDVSVDTETFVHKVERLKVQILEGVNTRAAVETIREDIGHLPSNVYKNYPKREAAFKFALSSDLEHASVEQLDEVIEQLAAQMRFRTKRNVEPLLIDLSDYIVSRGYIVLTKTGEEIYVDEYRRRVEERVVTLVDSHPTIEAIRLGTAVTDDQLIDLERTLRNDLTNSILELNDDNLHIAYGPQVNSLLSLVRKVLELDAAIVPDYHDIVVKHFEDYIATNNNRFGADQILFLRHVATVLSQRHQLVRADLYDKPFTQYGQFAVERLFSAEEIHDILDLATRLAA